MAAATSRAGARSGHRTSRRQKRTVRSARRGGDLTHSLRNGQEQTRDTQLAATCARLCTHAKRESDNPRRHAQISRVRRLLVPRHSRRHAPNHLLAHIPRQRGDSRGACAQKTRVQPLVSLV
jgi:hypothetical protein